jgi:F-type H+-transporting ATPase subunit gamma
MVGQFNDQIASFAAEQLPREMDPEAIVAVGQRTAVKLEDQGMQVRLTLPVPGSVSGINWTVQELLLETDRLRSQGVEQIMIFHHRPLSGASYRPQRQILFPASREWLRELAGRKWESRSLPIYRMETDELFISLMRQHYYVMLFRAVAESLASENASRLSSMQAAEKNIEERLSELGTRYHRQRQAAVTSELLDIVAGFESLSGP